MTVQAALPSPAKGVCVVIEDLVFGAFSTAVAGRLAKRLRLRRRRTAHARRVTSAADLGCLGYEDGRPALSGIDEVREGVRDLGAADHDWPRSV